MTPDPRFASRLIAARADLADERFQGQVEAARFVAPVLQSVVVPVLDQFSSPHAKGLASQLLLGEQFAVLERKDGLAWGYACRDDYVGYVDAQGLGPLRSASQYVTARSTHVYAAPNFKTNPIAALSFGSKLDTDDAPTRFRKAPLGYVPEQHLDQALGIDFVSIAERFLGTPYVWGGRSAFGLDCSALVQLALQAVGIDAPRDSDMQEAMLGAELSADEMLRRGDLVFWKGHVGIMADEATLLHANAGAMAVALEEFAAACIRIEAAGDGPVTSRRRLK